jgi:hypothetical protein
MCTRAAKPAVAAFDAPGGHAATPEGSACRATRADIAAAIDRIAWDAAVEFAAVIAASAKRAVAAFSAAGRHAVARYDPAGVAGRTFVAAAIHHTVRDAASPRPAMRSLITVSALAALHRAGRDRVLGYDASGEREDDQCRGEWHEKSGKRDAKPDR